MIKCLNIVGMGKIPKLGKIGMLDEVKIEDWRD